MKENEIIFTCELNYSLNNIYSLQVTKKENVPKNKMLEEYSLL